MKKKLATALREARKIAVTPAHVLRENRPQATNTKAIPMSRWIQPHAVVSRSNV
jgi:hypothetical protein